MIRDVEEAGAWLEGLINFERRPGFSYARMGLEPIRGLLARLGRPDKALSILHVAGSKGKGSTCLLAESILLATGERVGTFTSPHLERWSERFRLDGREVEGDALAAAVEAVRPHVELMRRDDPGNAPTFFDATTAVALLLFEQSGVDRALLEVGLGGRLDSTNAVQPAVTCITQIELEHTDKLGETLAAIAAEKAGILKPATPCVVGWLPGEAMRVVRARADELGAPLHEAGTAFVLQEEVTRRGSQGAADAAHRYTARDGFTVSFALPVLGGHQAGNAALALAAVRLLGRHDDQSLAEAARRGLANAALPGRVERLGERPWVIVDAAHTERSIGALGEVLAQQPAARRHLLLSVSRDKDPRRLLAALAWRPDVVWCTRAEPVRSLDPADLAAVVRAWAPAAEVHTEPDPARALAAARGALSADDGLCCTGSVYLAGAARRVLSPQSEARR